MPDYSYLEHFKKWEPEARLAYRRKLSLLLKWRTGQEEAADKILEEMKFLDPLIKEDEKKRYEEEKKERLREYRLSRWWHPGWERICTKSEGEPSTWREELTEWWSETVIGVVFKLGFYCLVGYSGYYLVKNDIIDTGTALLGMVLWFLVLDLSKRVTTLNQSLRGLKEKLNEIKNSVDSVETGLEELFQKHVFEE